MVDQCGTKTIPGGHGDAEELDASTFCVTEGTISRIIERKSKKGVPEAQLRHPETNSSATTAAPQQWNHL
jgi:hypothetical protein